MIYEEIISLVKIPLLINYYIMSNSISIQRFQLKKPPGNMNEGGELDRHGNDRCSM